jgi:predicted lipoprotein with Yx(FWY)xxD motif
MTKHDRHHLIALSAILAIAVCIAPAIAARIGVFSTMPAFKGGVLVDERGMTLYVFAKDGPGASNCNGKCATIWPPLLAPSDTSAASAEFSIVKRADGTKQWAFKGHPLYLFVRDTAPGQRNGNGFKGLWRVVKL